MSSYGSKGRRSNRMKAIAKDVKGWPAGDAAWYHKTVRELVSDHMPRRKAKRVAYGMVRTAIAKRAPEQAATP